MSVSSGIFSNGLLSSDDQHPNAFKKLVKDLNDVLGPSSGLDSADVDPKDIQNLMRSYESNEKEWQYYALGDASRTYTRNLVDHGNGKSDLLILVWSPGKESPIHDHANSHCVMKVLRGSLRETRYAWPDSKQENTSGQKSPLHLERETVFAENEVTYMSDELGLHKISNNNLETFSVSLHLYTPPNASKFGMYLFNKDTGESSHAKQSDLFSVCGFKREPQDVHRAR